jgi:hypothetical protein
MRIVKADRHGKRRVRRSGTVDALHRQIAHEAWHRTLKYDEDGNRKPESLPPHHLPGTRWPLQPSKRYW